MSLVNRRQSIQLFLNRLLQTTGTVVVASAVLPTQVAKAEDGVSQDLATRADQVAIEGAKDTGVEDPCGFLNGGFANGGFRNGGFANGAFRKGGFVNGGFHNGGFGNGGFRNGGGFGNGGFRNGGFVNGGFRN
jgi:hypothetical protein